MAITEKDVLYAADLARLSLTQEEIGLYTQQLKRILDHAEKLSALDTSNVLPTNYTENCGIALREDIVRPSLQQERALEGAPLQDRGYFKVPQIIE